MLVFLRHCCLLEVSIQVLRTISHLQYLCHILAFKSDASNSTSLALWQGKYFVVRYRLTYTVNSDSCAFIAGCCNPAIHKLLRLRHLVFTLPVTDQFFTGIPSEPAEFSIQQLIDFQRLHTDTGIADAPSLQPEARLQVVCGPSDHIQDDQ